MKKTSSIIKLSLIGVAIVLGIILAVCSFRLPFSIPIQGGLDKYTSFASAIEKKLGIDLKGGIYAIYDVADPNDTENLSERLEGTRTRLSKLLFNKGYSEALVTREGDTRIRVEVPGVEDTKEIFKIIGKPAKIKFVIEGETILTGDEHVVKATAISNYEGNAAVELSFNSAGADIFFKATTDNVGKTMSIITTVDGEDTEIAKPSINAGIAGGKAVISPMESYETAKELADQIMAGAFDVQLKLLESNTISPKLGDEALLLSVIAGAVALFLVIVFLCCFYRLLGGAAGISLVIYTILLLFFLAVLPWVQLTLPGLAGIILSLGMAVDANIIIYERIKDEYRLGKSIKASVNAGFKKATVAILDSNVTTIIACVVLFFLGTGAIKGFALTLFIGIVLSMFTSLLVTRGLIKYFTNLNDKNPNLYNLKRGKDYVEPDYTSNPNMEIDNSVVIDTSNPIDATLNNNVLPEGGLANENN